MSDIADEAGASRQSVYRFFEDRSALIQYILNQRISRMAHQLHSVFMTYETLDQAVIDGSVASLAIARADPLYNAIVLNSTDHNLDLFLVRGSDEIHQTMLENWGPILDRARGSGALRQDLSNSEIVEWIRQFHTGLAIRDDFDEAAQRRALRNFLLPSLKFSA